MNIALWVLQILFAALFMLHAVLHLFPSPRLKGILTEQNIPVKRTIATWAEVVASLGLILPGAVSIATWLTPLAALGLAVVMVGRQRSMCPGKRLSPRSPPRPSR